MITLEQIEEMFADLRDDSEWGIDGEMLWGYFFMDADPKKLERASQQLVKDGYVFVSIRETDDNSLHVLHVERVEKHSPQSLHARNAELYKLAKTFELYCYDGMDVGPVEEEDIES